MTGIVYELYVNGKRFEDLTQALPSPVRIRPTPLAPTPKDNRPYLCMLPTTSFLNP